MAHYDPLPDIATVLRGVYFTPAHELPAGTIDAFGRLALKLKFDTKDVGPMAGTADIEAALRRYLTPDEPAT